MKAPFAMFVALGLHTGVAAVALGRRFIGIEKDTAYRQLSHERMKAALEVDK